MARLHLPFHLPQRLGRSTFLEPEDTEVTPKELPPRWRFILCPVLSTVPFAEIELVNVKFTQSVDGSGTTLEADAFLSESQSGERLRSILNYPNDPKAIAIYVKFIDTYYWGGVIQSRPWDKDKRAFSITATSWKAWLYQRFIGPDATVNPPAEVSYSWTGMDQFTIAQELVNLATSGYGTPSISTPAASSGILRDLSFYGSEFIYAGDAIDRMANRDRGFEWDIAIGTNDAGHPRLDLSLSYPKNQLVNNSVLFKSTDSGGNVTAFTSPDDSSETVITRVWGTGSGSSGADLLIAYDEEPSLPSDQILLVESKEYANSSTTQIETVASHVQGIRQFHSSGLQQISITVPLDLPDFRSYFIGNKIRLIIRDEVLDLDFRSVRIVRRTFNLSASGESPKEDSIELLIDLNDTQLPEDETAL